MNTPLRRIPGVGKNMAAHLESLGIRWVEDLRGQDPQELYDRDCRQHGYQDAVCCMSTAVPCILPKRRTRIRKSANGGTGRMSR